MCIATAVASGTALDDGIKAIDYYLKGTNWYGPVQSRSSVRQYFSIRYLPMLL